MSRNLTPPAIARRYGVSASKVLDWIRNGELAALDLARRGCTRPRYSVTPEALEAFERSRQVIPQGGERLTRKLRRRSASEVKQFF